jgi:DNA-binding transcriptional ArsR family regulator
MPGLLLLGLTGTLPLHVDNHFGQGRSMIGIASIAEIAALIGDPARANILFALRMDGQVSAGDLTKACGVSPSTTSEHLAKLARAGLVTAIKDGRRRYYKLAHPDVADVLDCLEGFAGKHVTMESRRARWDRATIHARGCLDHVAGRLGGQLAHAMIAQGHVALAESGPDLTMRGADWLRAFGADVDHLRASPRRIVGLCPDWIETSPHLSGAVGRRCSTASDGRTGCAKPGRRERFGSPRRAWRVSGPSLASRFAPEPRADPAATRRTQSPKRTATSSRSISPTGRRLEGSKGS